MEAGALGIGTALIYPPAFYSKTDELIELCKVAAKYKGKYISHMRSEGNQLLEAFDELLRISREAGIPAEVYHIKAAGEKNWGKIDNLLSQIEAAQKEGLNVRANMYTYTAAGTGLDACLPPWTEEGGYPALFKRVRDPATREKIAAEVKIDSDKLENLYIGAGSPDNILLVAFKSEKLKPLTGKTLATVAKMRGKDPITTIMDLIAEDESRIGTIYLVMSEENVKKEIAKPWISFCSDEASQAPEGVFLKSNPHPRAYGSFVRVLGKYVRDEKVITLSEAVRRLSALPATNLGLDHRGFLKEGMFADVVVFDPATIADRATFEKPHQYAIGVKHVFVNGAQVLKDGEPTGAKPGRALWGPGKINQSSAAAQAKPSPPPARWRGLIGEYGPDNDLLYVLEKDGKLCALFKRVELETLKEVSNNVFKFDEGGAHTGKQLVFTRDAQGRATEAAVFTGAGAVTPGSFREVTLKRRQVGPEEGAPQLHITPVRPVKELLKEALAAEPPKESGEFRQPDLVIPTKFD